ncbi:MAG: peptidylprolyl isomerase [Flavobacteriaceae bacterium]|nr:peptidylprolyl isomerase [Flavobacteriaceae bacterium]
MQLKIKNLKRLPLTSFALLFAVFAYGQELVIDSTQVIQDDPVLAATPATPQQFKRFKAEGVSAVVGEYVILDSDIDKSYVELKQQGVAIEGIDRCQVLGKLMEDKLYAHQAKQDSISIPSAEVQSKVDQQIQYMISELGSEEKVATYYRKDNIEDLKKELFDVNMTLGMAGEMQRIIVEDVEITPEEVRNFFFSIPEDERPYFSAEIEVAQLVIEPEITEEAREEVIDRLTTMRRDIVEGGASFASKAVLYSKDGSAAEGGLIEGVRRNSPLDKEFKDQAFSLLEGEVSEPFESSFGFHIIQVDRVRGQEIDLRHIILFPEVSSATIEKARTKLDSIRTQIVNGHISFAEAARKFSDEKETRTNGGLLVNPITGDTRFDLTKMDPTLSAQVYNLKAGEVSQIFTDRDRTGKAKYKILTVNKKFEEHPADFSKDYERIQALALKQKQIKAIEAWQNKTIRDTYVSINEDYQDCEFSSNWKKN